jgi:hypothetical protein
MRCVLTGTVPIWLGTNEHIPVRAFDCNAAAPHLDTEHYSYLVCLALRTLGQRG